jgi:pseudouridine synthase
MRSSGTKEIRLNRFLSMCGVASRRKADEMIEEGRVTVNERVVTDLGLRIDSLHDRVYADGRQVTIVHDLQYLVLNKPRDTITTTKDERGRSTVMDLIRTRHRVYPVGRLDRNTTGVLLLTNDGEFANRLMHPRYRVPKSYRVRCATPVNREDLAQLRAGIRLEDGMTEPARVVALPGGKGTEIGITISEGRNRQVRRMFETLGYEVKALDRLAYGPVTYEGLPRGAFRKLRPQEIKALEKLAGTEGHGGAEPVTAGGRKGNKK